MRGSTWPRPGHSHHTAAANSATAPATRPTWKPEIAIRWVSPAARSVVQSCSSSPRVSPSASARTKRDEGDGTAAAIRADIRPRQASMPRGGPSGRAPPSPLPSSRT